MQITGKHRFVVHEDKGKAVLSLTSFPDICFLAPSQQVNWEATYTYFLHHPLEAYTLTK